MVKRQIICAITTKRQIACVIMKKRQLTCAISEKKEDNMCYHGEILFQFENIISGIQLYNKKYHQKLNHF